jgi:copper chaperone CopZ
MHERLNIGSAKKQCAEQPVWIRNCIPFGPDRPQGEHRRRRPTHLFARGIIEDKRENQMPEFKLRIDGMHCGACIRRVSQALASVEGVQVEAVQVGEARFTSSLNTAPVDLAIAALAKAGYPARLEE